MSVAAGGSGGRRGSDCSGNGANSGLRYERVEQIGSGTFGHAWLVKSRASGRQYVVKEIKVTSLPEHEREQSVNEVAILSQCKHVNIIRYKEAFIEQASGSLNIVMEYADGGDLYARIVSQRAKDDHFPEEVVLNWFIQITFAVQYLHSKNILHRDLKTQNIFLTSDSLVKVGDFGIARTLRSTQELATTAIGTPYYLSPEICQRQPYNHKSDQWAVGCIVYEMCCLTHPFNANSFENLVLKILQARYNPIPSHYSLLLRDLVTVLLRTQPDRRPSAEQVLMIPALKPYVDTYVQWQNAALSSRVPSIQTSASTISSSTDSHSSSSGSNSSDAADHHGLCSSQEDVNEKAMTPDSLETPIGASAPPEEPRQVEARSGSRRRSVEARPWSSQYANLIAEGGDSDRSSERSSERGAEQSSERAVPRAQSEQGPKSTERARLKVTERGRSGTRRREGAAGGSSETEEIVPFKDRDVSSSLERVPDVIQMSANDAATQQLACPGGSARPRSYSLSSLSPKSPTRGHDANGPFTPTSAKAKIRAASGRGPSALIRQVLKNKFTRQEPRPRSASDPVEEPAASKHRHRGRESSPAKVFRRPSLTIARFTTPEARSPSRHVTRSRSPVPPPGRSPLEVRAPRASPAPRSGRRLEEPVTRSGGPKLAKPVERPPAQSVRRDGVIRSDSSDGNNTSSSSVQKSQQRPQWARVDDRDQLQAVKKPNWAQTKPGPQPLPDAPGGSLPQAGAPGTSSGYCEDQCSTEIDRQCGGNQQDQSPPDDGGRQCEAENQEEKTLVNLTDHLQDINHNDIKVSGGQLHQHLSCQSGTCCALICAQCRYASDEQLARVMWACRIRPGGPPDPSELLARASQSLGNERLRSMMTTLRANWNGPDLSTGTLDSTLKVLGRENVNLLPLLMQVVQLENTLSSERRCEGGGGQV